MVIPGYVSVGKNARYSYAPLFLVLEEIYGYMERAGGDGGVDGLECVIG